jgi:hypothetical protein
MNQDMPIGLAVAGAMLTVGTVRPSGLDETSGHRIRDMVVRQIEAFRRNDAAAAFSFAAESVRRLFAGPEAFLAVVASRYAAIYRPSSIEFAKLKMTPLGLTQGLRVVADDGSRWIALMIIETDRSGAYKIAGCHLDMA